MFKNPNLMKAMRMMKQTSKNHKLKYIIISIALSLVIGLSAILLILHNTEISYYIQAEKPTAIIVYKSSENNAYYSSNDKEFIEIYDSITSSFKQNKLDALFNKKLLYKPSIHICENTNISFNNIVVRFVYSTPQSLQLNNSSYEINGHVYWYTNLIFTLKSTNEYSYTNIAVIPDDKDSNFIGSNTYNVYYKSYANFTSTYNLINAY